MKSFLICAIIFTTAILNISCAKKENNIEPPIINQYEIAQCRNIDRNINVKKESIKNSSYTNQFILTENIIKLDNKLREAYSIIDCYELQLKSIEELKRETKSDTQ